MKYDMTIPDHKMIMLPLLKFLSDGQRHTLRDTIEALSNELNLINKHNKRLSSRMQGIFDNEVRNAEFSLKELGFVRSAQSSLVITNSGLEALKDGIKFIDSNLFEEAGPLDVAQNNISHKINTDKEMTSRDYYNIISKESSTAVVDKEKEIDDFISYTDEDQEQAIKTNNAGVVESLNEPAMISIATDLCNHAFLDNAERIKTDLYSSNNKLNPIIDVQADSFSEKSRNVLSIKDDIKINLQNKTGFDISEGFHSLALGININSNNIAATIDFDTYNETIIFTSYLMFNEDYIVELLRFYSNANMIGSVAVDSSHGDDFIVIRKIISVEKYTNEEIFKIIDKMIIETNLVIDKIVKAFT